MKAAQPKAVAQQTKKNDPFFPKHGRGNFFGFSGHEKFFSRASDVIQEKLVVGKSDDRYEKEADAMAAKVVQRLAVKTNKDEGIQARPLVSSISPLIQTKSKIPGDELQKKEEVLQEPPKKLQSKSIVQCDDEEEYETSRVQMKCAACEREDHLQKRESSSPSTVAPNQIEGKLDGAKGNGSPLPRPTREKMEGLFGADFSKVRLHLDSAAIQMNKDLHAQAFTHGNDIFFNAGKFNPDTKGGDHLIGHELTHVLQQRKSPLKLINREDEPGPDTKGPKALLEDRQGDYEIDPDNEDITSIQKAETRRAALLLQAEIDLHDQPGYSTAVTGQFSDLEDYVNETINGIHAVSSSEEQTIDKLIVDKDLNIPSADFAIHPFFAQNISAFPNSFLNIITPLTQPPYDEGNSVLSDADRASRHLENTRGGLSHFFFEEGLPVSRDPSLTLSGYELIKSRHLRLASLKLAINRPRSESDFDFVIEPEETKLHHGFLSMYDSAWTSAAINLYSRVLYTMWAGNFKRLKRSIEDGEISGLDSISLRNFREKHSSGLSSIDDLIHYQAEPAAVGYAQGFSPFTYYNLIRFTAVWGAAKNTGEFIENEYAGFLRQLLAADQRIQTLLSMERLGKALHWSVKKGFALEGILAVVNNFDKLLLDILKEKVKRSVFRRIVSFVASLHPLGRLAVLAYEVYKAAEEVKDVLDVVELIHMTASVIDEAKDASTVVEVQRSAAQLSKVYEHVIPVIVQKLSADLRKKIMKGSKKAVDEDAKHQEPKSIPDKPKHPLKHDRKKLLDGSKDMHSVDQLKRDPKYLHAELGTAASGGIRKSSHPDYDVEATLANGHKWRRNAKGVWCRFSEDAPTCILSHRDLPEDARKELEDLDRKVEQYKQAKGAYETLGEEDLEQLSKAKNPPGSKKQKAATALGTFVHSKVYVQFINWLDTVPGQQWLASKNLSRADLALNLPQGNIKREFEIQHPYYSQKPRADVVDFDNAVIHEIKPRGSEARGFRESQQYAEWMNKYHERTDGRQWRAGPTITYDGQKVLDIFKQFGFFED